jgi:glycosyltransferase involved in cell wall biosynthesis
MTSRTVRGRRIVVFAPLGVSAQSDIERISSLAQEQASRPLLVIPEGRPQFLAGLSGYEVANPVLRRNVAGLLALLGLVRRLRASIRGARGRAILLDDSDRLAPYYSTIRACLRLLAVKEILVLDRGSIHAEQARLPRLVDLFRAAANNAKAWVLARHRARALHSTVVPVTRPGEIQRLLYVRTDLAYMQTDEPGGSSSHTAGVVRGLTDLNVEVFCATPRPVDAAEWLPVRGGPPQDIHVELARAVWDESVEDFLNQEAHDVDAVYTRYSLLTTSAAAIARRLQVPLILEFNCSEANFFNGKSLRFRRLAREVERALCQTADLVVVVSERVRDEVVAQAPDANTVVSPNAVDVEQFVVSDEERTKARLALGYAEEDVVVGFFGRFYAWHGIVYLAQACAKLFSKNPKLRLLLVGDGPDRDAALGVLRTHMDYVQLLGVRPHNEVPPLMAACDILVSPHAPIDGFVGSPMKIFEYMASGRAIIASELEQIGQVLEHERTALLVQPGHVEGLAEALTRLASDPILRSRLGSTARSVAREQHTWTGRMKVLLDMVAAERQSGPGIG